MKELIKAWRESDPRMKAGAKVLGVAILLILILPLFFLKYPLFRFDFPNSSPVGDTMGGILGPLIAIIAAILTFLAFWIQYQANQMQIRNFDKQSVDIAKDRFEARVYELLNIHRQNLAEMEFNELSGKIHKGREIFPVLYREFVRTYNILDEFCKKNNDAEELNDKEKKTQLAWLIFYVGITDYTKEQFKPMVKKILKSDDVLAKIIEHFLKIRKNDEFANFVNQTSNRSDTFVPNHFTGHIPRIGHYYRHLYQMVKYIVDYDDKIITEAEKRNLLRTIRAQLSSHEQLLLYYNAVSPFGRSWIRRGFLTKYRMIRNIPLPLANIGITPEEMFAKELAEYSRNDQEPFEWYNSFRRED